ncbi:MULTISPECIES: AAA family ATPase [Methanobrevibacter]|jgi:hypothetical protein|uniref:ATPase involved in DNA repair, SbcC n=1 Tax=Methanobrevibacter smithii (strain ATCC 35061 / DSM 861 / OCM 144 / PS) TaxID=420247 RepID=A5UL20_METS3|nr:MULTISPECIES: AAA family ATPase [Methanobrevibacter]ABQ86898.1 ATPase involved in DNA repair, SbcC [Methanobrevibacter smithii ATCC 35061]OED03695.1 hypothetical protein A9757_05355 [Methanobrevibacter sp. A54]
MYLDSIEITNFRPFYGTQKIDFGFNDLENLTIILADNGSGKTSLVNALTWCLYGEELHDVRNKSEPLYNLRAAKELESNENSINEVKVEVKIRFYSFEDEKKKYFSIYRSLSFQKWGNGKWGDAFADHLIVDETDKDILEDGVAQNAINNKIPKEMFQYFFFNGATLSNYFKNESELSLKTSIEQISQVGLIDKVYDHLVKTSDSINKRFNKKKPKGSVNYNKLINEKMQEQQHKESEIKDNHNKIDIAIRNVNKCVEKLKQVDSGYVNELTQKRKNKESMEKKLKQNIKEDRKNYEKLILELFPIAVLFDELVDSINIADDARKKKTAPPQIERDLLNDILEDGFCICGVKLEDHPECVTELKKRLNNTSKIKQEVFYEDYYDLKKVLTKLKDLPKIESLRRSIKQNEENINEINIQINQISDELAEFDIEDVREYERQSQKNKKIIEDLRKRNKSLSADINTLKKDIEKLKRKRSEAGELEGELKILNNKIKFCEEAITILSDLNNNVQKHIREKVNDKTRKQFTSINWAYDKYRDVTIKDDYKIVITKSTGQKITPGDLSDGEENLLALSFMMALHSLSGFEIPLIIDAPLEKLDKSKRIEFISGLHEYTSDKQIIFLFTDSQYTDDVRANMLQNIADEYELKPYENKTEIVKHG